MKLSVLKPESIVNEIFARYEKYGNKHSADQSASQLEQVSYAAALAEEEGFEDEVVLAAFFHDIGNLSANSSNHNEGEKSSANYLRELGFSERLATLVESDVRARRFLASKYPEYYDQLSETEKASLESQGGPMSKQEIANFELDPDAELFVRLRYWNDKARKGVKKYTRNMAHYKLLAMSHLYKVIDQYLPGFLMPKTIVQR
ncbi:MAG TPA: hypothetical protein VK668_23370 [Mucilaginibacter sp.]|nr:hypothetical protein [Mucilaginibacter sp.]